MSRPKKDRPPPEPPRGLEAVRIADGDDEYVVLSFPVGTHALPPSLSPAEIAVVELALAGMRTKAIAAARGVSERTVGNQLQSAYAKLGVASRAELAARLR